MSSADDILNETDGISAEAPELVIVRDPNTLADATLAGTERIALKQSGNWLRTTVQSISQFATDVYSVALYAGITGVARTLLDILRDQPVNLKNFNADPTGATDSLAAFNAAGALGKMVNIPRGTYVLSGFPVGKFYTDDPVRPVFVNYAPKEFGLYQPASGIHYAGEGANIHRLADRVLIGEATKASGVNTAIQGDWLTAYQLSTGRSSGFIQSAQAASLNDNNSASTVAFVAGAHTQHLAGGSAIGQVSIAVNDVTNPSAYAFAQYVEAYRNNADCGAAFGMEIDVVNKGGAAVPINPYAQNQKETVALQLAAGRAELSPIWQSPSSAAINIWNNGSSFDKGIVFGDQALSRAGNTSSGAATAIAMARNHMVRWFVGDGQAAATLRCDNTTSSASMNVLFLDNQLYVQSNSNGAVVFQVRTPTNPANHLAVVAAIAGSAVGINAYGADANIDIALTPAGSGVLKFGAYTAGALSATGYITVKDSSGTVRRLLVG